MNDISQDQRQVSATLDAGNTIVYVEYTSTGFQWGTSTGSLQPLSTTIDINSSTSITFEFLRIGSNAIWYKLPPSSITGTVLPTASPGPTVLVAPKTRTSIAFANSSGGPYSTGYVKVSDDGFDDLVDDGDGDDRGDDDRGDE